MASKLPFELTQFLIFELGHQCNLGHIHTRCPNSLGMARFVGLDTSRPLSDELIVESAVAAYLKHGFTGFIGWHYYNEPTLQMDRMLALMARIKARAPQARFVLWTNGIIRPTVEQSEQFDHCYESRYNRDATDNLILDHRMGQFPVEAERPCARVFVECIIDAFGNHHPCCYDWRGEASLGNLHDLGIDFLAKKWLDLQESVGMHRMADDAPLACRRCGFRQNDVPDFEPAIQHRTRQHRSRPFGVVFSHYRIPQWRLNDHFQWNEEFYKGQCHVFVVTENEMDVPPYATAIPLPEKLTIYNPCKTKNHGLRAAIEAGCDPIAVIDTDICWTRESWNKARSVRGKRYFNPICLMAQNYPEREAKSAIDVGMAGCIIAAADLWAKTPYDERFEGYGLDEDKMRIDLKKNGGIADRYGIVYHIAHNALASQTNIPGHGRDDCWNRLNGFNPDNAKANCLLMADELRKEFTS